MHLPMEKAVLALQLLVEGFSVRTTERIIGESDPAMISTSHAERQNLTMRMQIKRLACLTLCFSKKWEYLWYAIAPFCVLQLLPHSQEPTGNACDGIWTS